MQCGVYGGHVNVRPQTIRIKLSYKYPTYCRPLKMRSAESAQLFCYGSSRDML